jgi:hypothetical protein
MSNYCRPLKIISLSELKIHNNNNTTLRENNPPVFYLHGVVPRIGFNPDNTVVRTENISNSNVRIIKELTEYLDYIKYYKRKIST